MRLPTPPQRAEHDLAKRAASQPSQFASTCQHAALVPLSSSQRVERDFAKYAASQPRRADGPYAELLPWLGEQAADWEVAATANCAGDTPAVRVSA